MENETVKQILLIITNPFAATNVIHSGLLELLARRYKVHILSDLIKEKEISEINRHYGIQVELLWANIPIENRTLRLLRKLEKAIFFRHFKIITQTIKEQNHSSLLRFIVKATLSTLDFLKLTKPLLKLLRYQIIKRSGKCDQFERIIASNFNGVISTSPLDIRENIIVNSLKENIKTLAMVISWDNLTTKGLINADHDYIVVWNKFMAEEYQTFYQIFKLDHQKICITGIPRFDPYFLENPGESGKTAYRQKFQFKQDEKMILFATSAAKHFPDQVDIVRHLSEYARIRTQTKIIVRCHPGDRFEKYQVFETDQNIRITCPENLADQDSSIPALNTLSSLCEVLMYTDICIQIASTMRLDAAACNKPIISIAYDGDKSQPYSKSIRRFYDYDHQLPLNELNIDRMVFNKQELFDALDEALFNPKFKLQPNRELAKEFTHFSEPVSVATTMKFIDEWLN